MASDPQKFPVGQCYSTAEIEGNNATGGVDYIDACGKVVAMGDCLHNDATPNAPSGQQHYDIYGIQQFHSGGGDGSTSGTAASGYNYTANSYLVDVDCLTDTGWDGIKKWLGDIEVYRKEAGCTVTANASADTQPG